MSDHIVYPIHMQRKRTTGDVTFGKRDSTGLHVRKTTSLDMTGSVILKYFVLKFEEGGTGFILAPLNISINIKQENHLIVGLVLTAGHVVCDTTTFKQIKD